MKPSIVVLSGPTASGKSELGVLLAKKLRGEIINADSVQVYQECEIGAAKPRAEALQMVPHHLLSILRPDEEFNAGIFRKLASEKIYELHSNGIIPLVVGGTGLYIAALLCGLVAVDGDLAAVKKQIAADEQKLRERGETEEAVASAMHRRLEELDPQSALRLHVHDLVRIRRALAVKMLSGSSLSVLHHDHQHGNQEFRALVVVLLPEREGLYRRIDTRAEQMFAAGLVDEVKRLSERYGRGPKLFSAIGYRQVLSYLDQTVDEQTMVASMKQDTRRFAKRQFTWWRNQPKRLGFRDISNHYAEMVGQEKEQRKEQNIVDKLSQVISRFLSCAEPFKEEGIDFLVLNDLELNSRHQTDIERV